MYLVFIVFLMAIVGSLAGVGFFFLDKWLWSGK